MKKFVLTYKCRVCESVFGRSLAKEEDVSQEVLSVNLGSNNIKIPTLYAYHCCDKDNKITGLADLIGFFDEEFIGLGKEDK